MSFAELSAISTEKLLEAKAETTITLSRLIVTLFSFGLFCVLTLASPDIHLIGEVATLDVPFAGRMSFSVFFVIGPLVLLGLRIHLHVYEQHRKILDRTLSSIPHIEKPTVSLCDHPLLRLFSTFVIYLLVPIVMMDFAYKARGLVQWIRPMFLLTSIVITIHFVVHP